MLFELKQAFESWIYKIINQSLKQTKMNINQIITRKIIGKKALILSAFAFTVIASSAAIVFANADFSGEWKLNESKSTLGQFGGRTAKKLKIEGNVESIAIQRASTNQAGEEMITNEKLTFDDKESESTVFGNNKKKSKAKWSDDGKTLTVKSTIVFDRNGESMEIKTTEIWTLMDDGKTLSIESTSTSSRGTNITKLIYDKVTK